VVAGCIDAAERTLMLAAQRLVHLSTVRRWLAGGTLMWPSAALGSRRDGWSSSIHDGAANPVAHTMM